MEASLFFYIIFYITIFIFGLTVGSFLNCIIYRLQKEESFLVKRSYCPHCQHTLGWQDLIPLLSFVFLKGRCRYCKKPISLQYPLVEISTALIFLLIFNFQFLISNAFLATNFNFINTLYYLTIASFLIVIFVFDLKHYIIPDKIIFPVIGIALFYQLFGNWKLEIENLQPLLNPLFSAILASAFFLLIILASHGKWMGWGDVKLAFFMGLFLGFPNILVALFLAFFFGAIIRVGVILACKKGF